MVDAAALDAILAKPPSERTPEDWAAQEAAWNTLKLGTGAPAWDAESAAITYSPEIQSYLSGLNAYASGIGNPYYHVNYDLAPTPPTWSDPLTGLTTYKATDPSVYQKLIDAKTPYEQGVSYGVLNPVTGYLGNNGGGYADIGYDTPMALVDRATGKVVSTGTGYKDADAMMKQIEALAGSQHSDYKNWALYTQNPAGEWSTSMGQYPDPDPSGLGQLADIALPLALTLIPGVGTALAGALGTSGAVGTAAAAALGSGLSGTLQGKSAGDILKQAAISGLSAYAGGQLLGGGSPSATLPPSGTLADVASWGATPLVDAAGRALPSAVFDNLAASGLGGLSGVATGLAPEVLNEILVTASKAIPALTATAVGSAVGAAAPSALDAAHQFLADNPLDSYNSTQDLQVKPPETQGADLVAIGNKGALPPTPATVGSAVGAAVPGSTYDPATNTIKVVADTKPVEPTPAPIYPPYVLPPTFNEPIPVKPVDTTAIANDPAAQPAGTSSGLSVYDKLQAALKAAGLLAGAAGGTKAPASGAVIGAGNGALSPVFSAKLPDAPNIPGGVGTAGDLAARAMPQQDWTKYGFKPEQSFYNYVPQRLARGGEAENSFAVRGAGDGRSDSIPAVLSDGEYVIDAETVALLGNGSSKAGAEKLDDMRVKIRKHKGRDLARGAFSAKAKQPEAYLGGGRT